MQPDDDAAPRQAVDSGVMLLSAASLIAGTIYIVTLVLEAQDEITPFVGDVVGPLAMTGAVITTIRAGVVHLSRAAQERGAQWAEGYAAGYVDGVGRKEPMLPAGLRAIK